MRKFRHMSTISISIDQDDLGWHILIISRVTRGGLAPDAIGELTVHTVDTEDTEDTVDTHIEACCGQWTPGGLTNSHYSASV